MIIGNFFKLSVADLLKKQTILPGLDISKKEWLRDWFSFLMSSTDWDGEYECENWINHIWTEGVR